jgi:hypothetical protein
MTDTDTRREAVEAVIARLNAIRDATSGTKDAATFEVYMACCDAVEAIHNLAARAEAAEARVRELREALKPFAAAAPAFDEWRTPSPYGRWHIVEREHRRDDWIVTLYEWPSSDDAMTRAPVYAGDFRRARAALDKEPTP